jgi:membrane-bound serine protease (ClpP class)
MRRPGAVRLKAAAAVAVLALCAVTARSKEAPATKPAFGEAPAGATVTTEGWFAPPSPKFAPPALPPEVTRAFVIPIREPIAEKTYDAVKRKVIRCRLAGAEMIIFDMNTPGGRGDAMEDILRLVLDDMRDVYTVAYVDPEAFSAGAVISLACTEIVVSPTAVIGDAMPIMIGVGGELAPVPKEERSKIESGIRGIIRTTAENRGHSVALCEGMVTIGIEVWLIRNHHTGELRVVNAADERGKVRNAPAAGATQASVSAALATDWEYLRTIDGPESLVTLTGYEAVDAGLARRMLANMDKLRQHYNITAPPTVLEDTRSETLVEFLTSPVVAGILFFVGILGIYVEFNAPGHVLPGVAGLICLAIFFGSRYLIGMASWWMIALFILGVLLILVEILVVPGFGVPGVLGVIFCVVGLLVMLMPYRPGKWLPNTPLDWRLFTNGVLGVTMGFVGAVAAALAIAKYLHRLPVAGRLVLPSVVPPVEPTVTEGSPYLRVKAGDIGTVERMCRPVGKVRFGEDLLDAGSQGEIIEPGTAVRVLRREGNRLIVEKA